MQYHYSAIIFLVIFSFATTNSQAELDPPTSHPYLYDFRDRTPMFEGERAQIVGGWAIAKKITAKEQYTSDHLIITLVDINSEDPTQWAWIREGVLGADLNTDSNPIEFSWYPFLKGQDLSPFLIALRRNWGDTLIWRPAPVDGTMSFINWGKMNRLAMKAPNKNITIKNVPNSDRTHLATIGNSIEPVSHHRMWHFPVPPTHSLEIGEIDSPYKVTFQDASFDKSSPFLWAKGAKWAVQQGSCRNPYYDQNSDNPNHESYYQYIRWFSLSGLIEVEVPQILTPSKNAKLYTNKIKIHSDFRHIWGNAFFARSTPLTTSLDNLKKSYSNTLAGNEVLDVEISGQFYDAGIEFRSHGKAHPLKKLVLNSVTISDPFSLGTAYSGDGAPTSYLDGLCSTLSNPSLNLGVFGRASGSVIFEYGAASLTGYLVRELNGDNALEPMSVTYRNIGFIGIPPHAQSWDARKCCIPKIDGFAHDKNKAIRMKINVIEQFKKGRLNTPLAIEWGDDDSTGVGIHQVAYFEMVNAAPHFIPAPPLVPPNHYPKTPESRIHFKTTHRKKPVSGNPWVILNSNMTLISGSRIPYSLVLLGARDEKIPNQLDQKNAGDALIIEDVIIEHFDNIFHNVYGDAPAKIRLGNSNWAPPKYIWISGKLTFENVEKNGEIIYSPAWNNIEWTLRIDQILQPGVRIKLGKAQNYSGRTIENSKWYRGQIAQQYDSKSTDYFAALKDGIEKNSNRFDKKLWKKIDNPFDGMSLIYRQKKYKLPASGAIVDAKGNLTSSLGVPLSPITN